MFVFKTVTTVIVAAIMLIMIGTITANKKDYATVSIFVMLELVYIMCLVSIWGKL